MLVSLFLPFLIAALANGSIIRRQDSGPVHGTGQDIPSSGKADNTFNNGQPLLAAEPPDNGQTPPDVYGALPVDLPFGRLFHGNANFFSKGQYNTPDGITDKWVPDGTDSATQSACGIPDNAFSISKVAIHPYFLKYADLSRYCMQDVCISFWKEDGSSDMMLKVTDICSTDPSDPTHCATPMDIKIDRTKMKIMEKLTDNPDINAYPQLLGDQYPEKIWWFFTKCWADGLAQPAYQGNNWFTTPALPNNLKWSQDTQHQQWENNQAVYPGRGWQTYPNGAYNTERDDTTAPALSDWQPGDATPAWTPIAGGKGWGNPSGGGSTTTPSTTPATSNGTVPVGSQSGPGSAPSGPPASQDSGQSAAPSGGQPSPSSATPPSSSSSAPASSANQPNVVSKEKEPEQDDCDAEEL